MRVEDHFARICAAREAVTWYDIDCVCVWVGGCACGCVVHLCIALFIFLLLFSVFFISVHFVH